jgi:hypothetical protein
VGSAPTAAALEKQRIGVGGKFGFVARFESAALTAASGIGNFGKSLNKLGAAVQGATKTFEKVTEGGVDGVMGNLKGMFKSLFTKLVFGS